MMIGSGNCGDGYRIIFLSDKMETRGRSESRFVGNDIQGWNLTAEIERIEYFLLSRHK
jgi:hypothetical protein